MATNNRHKKLEGHQLDQLIFKIDYETLQEIYRTEDKIEGTPVTTLTFY